jgi:hypothetical protein
MSLPPKYLANLSPSQRVLQEKLIRKSQKKYQETGKVKDRPSINSRSPPRSTHAKKFQDKYGFPVTNLSRVRSEFPDTDIRGILAKGAAAYMSSGSRPNTSSYSWRFARLASVLTGGAAYKVDKDLVGERSRKKIFE